MRLPEFIIAGAPRSGTQWLYSVADRHPEIEMAKPLAPEPKFFLRDDLYARGLAYYSQTWFASIAPDKLAGEKSTNYLESPVVAQRIAADLPGVKLVFMLRNPVDRAFSNYLWSRQNGLETASFEEALEREAERERSVPHELAYARPHALFSRGLYAQLLRPYYDRIGADRILVLRFEDLAADPAALARRFHVFLGVEARPQDGLVQERINAARNDDGEQMSSQTRRQLSKRYAQPNDALNALVGTGFAGWTS